MELEALKGSVEFRGAPSVQLLPLPFKLQSFEEGLLVSQTRSFQDAESVLQHGWPSPSQGGGLHGRRQSRRGRPVVSARSKPLGQNGIKLVAATSVRGNMSAVWAENFISGASASFLSKLILQPFDTTKTILQASKQVRGSYSNLLDCAVGLVKTKGALSLYRGLIASVAVSAPSSAVFFTAYEYVKRHVETASKHPSLPLGFLSPMSPIIAAALGNVVSSVVRVPPEVIKQRVQAGVHRDMLEAVGHIWRKEGFGGFYTGYSTMVARDIPYAAIQFTVFEALKRRRSRLLLQQKARAGASEDERLTQSAQLLSNLWMGAVSGAIASVMTAPIDVVKTRVMTQAAAQNGMYLGMRQTFARIWAEEGLVAFGRGLAPRVLYKVPASAVFLVCYEGIRRVLRTARLEREQASLTQGGDEHSIPARGHTVRVAH